MTGLLGPNGAPITSKSYAKSTTKAPNPALGEAYGNWSGRNLVPITLPGGGLVQFDLNKLTLQDYRTMKDHYQVNASLSVLSFMQHQSDWHIECDDDKVKEQVTENLKQVWTQLNRAMSQANWAGYSPNVLQWENDVDGKQVVLTKVKDLLPEECYVEWKKVDGYAPPGEMPPKIRIFDGIKQFGQRYPIPIGNAYWYPLLMENGDYYGRKLLRPAYTSYFFSILIHLFSNRYYERFGEPVPVGRAPFDEEVDIGTADAPKNIKSTDYMLQVLQNLRNRSVVVLPSDRGEDQRTGYWEYDIEYLESQMRGADFSRYNSQLNEEISLAMFTPILLLQTADVGSYNLGVGHMQMYLWMLNAMNDDRASYINKYILKPMARMNFGKNAAIPRIVFRKLGNTDSTMLTAVLTALVQGAQVGFDLNELGQMCGLTLTQIGQTVGATPPVVDAGGADNTDSGTSGSGKGGTNADIAPPPLLLNAKAKQIHSAIVARVTAQVGNAYKADKVGELKINMGFRKQLEDVLDAEKVGHLYRSMDYWAADMAILGKEFSPTPEEFMSTFNNALNVEMSKVDK